MFLPVIAFPSVVPCGTTPGTRAVRFRMLRPFTGSSSTARVLTTWLRLASSVLSSGAAAWTSTRLGDVAELQ